jgi:hypothetical protein
MVQIGDKFKCLGTWYQVYEINRLTVTTIEDPDLNRYPNRTHFTYWGLSEVEEIIKEADKS